MQSSIWSLPGPAQFVETIRGELTSGRCVMALMPLFAPGGLRAALRGSLSDAWAWSDVNPDDVQAPAAALCQMYGVPPAATSALTVQSLANHESFAGRLMWLSVSDRATWAPWRIFLSEYADACRGVPEGKRSVFIAELQGFPGEAAPSEDVTLSNQIWSGVVGEIDLLVYASLQLQRSQAATTKKNLLALSVSRVALWDFGAAQRLLDGRPEDILSPSATLGEVARERGWNQETPINWETGTQCQCEGTTQIHSSLCVVTGDQRTVNHRLWSAQAGVLLPLIERRRHELLHAARRFVKLPVEIDGEVIREPEDLEIGHLAYQVCRSGADPRLKRRLDRLRRARNSLAHMESLDLGLAWHDDIHSQ